MRLVIQRVRRAQVSVDKEMIGSVKKGLLVYAGIEREDSDSDISWLCRKILGLRIFSDAEGKMNLSLSDIKGEMLVVSQFTLHAGTKKGMRPSFTNSAPPETAIPLYEKFISELKKSGLPVKTGKFGADMLVSSENDGPVTIWMDSKRRE